MDIMDDMDKSKKTKIFFFPYLGSKKDFTILNPLGFFGLARLLFKLESFIDIHDSHCSSYSCKESSDKRTGSCHQEGPCSNNKSAADDFGQSSDIGNGIEAGGIALLDFAIGIYS